MGKSPTFTEAELRRAIKVAGENDRAVRVIKRSGECEISFVMLEQPAKPEGVPENEPRRFGDKP